jgi:hypothetical protein
MSAATVTIRELAAALNRKPEQVEREAAELGMLVRPDWQARPSLTVDEARGLTTGEARRNLEHDRAWAQHQRDTRRWVEGRSRAVAEAARAVRAKAGTRGPGSVSQAARDAAVEAGVQYEKRNPRPAFGDGIYSVHLQYTAEEVSP